MGSTTQSTNMTPSTFVGYASPATSLFMQAVTSSGAYFTVGDASKILIFVANASSSDSATSGNIFVEPGAQWAGSRGLPFSSGSSVYSSATAPVSIALPTHGITGSSAIGSTTGSFGVLGPFESAMIKSSDNTVYIVASTGSTKMYAAVLALGSTN